MTVQQNPGSPVSSRPATSLLTWGTVAIVLVIVIVLVVIKVTGTSATSTSSGPAPPAPAPAAVVQAVTSIPPSVYDTVGITSTDTAVFPPRTLSGQPTLVAGGKPEVVFVGDEFCPYCAAERWALVAALSRFGKFTGLESMQSGTNEAFNGTQTFSFAGARYTSRYVAATLVEHYGDQKNATGTGYAVLHRLSSTVRRLMAKYDRTTTGAVVPFLDIANRAVVAGGIFSPAILEQLSASDIATGLADPRDPATQAIVAGANDISAVICSADGGQPTAVCSSTGVVTAATALGVTP
jgi:hypothetical protein